MKVAERIIEREGTIGGEKVAMTIDQDALAHIMSVLTDLYSDPELAIIREYSTNALDAHVEAGVTRPIEVQTPTPLSAFFVVRDFGVGMDAEDIRRVYSQYGTSTKRDTNDAVGMLGLGGKSALTYTDQFTLVGRKDGREVQVVVGRDEDGAGSMTIVADGPTDEPNGVEVIIPAKRHNALAEKAGSFFAYWQPGTVLLNGKEPPKAGGTKIGTTGAFIETNGNDHLVVMGNVPYPLRRDDALAKYLPTLGSKRRWILPVPIGSVNFAPSREALMANRTTREFLEALGKSLHNDLADSYAAQIAAEDDPLEAIRLGLEGKSLGIDAARLLYKGHAVTTSLSRDGCRTVHSSSNGYTYEGDYIRDKSYLLAGGSGGYRRGRVGGELLSSVPLVQVRYSDQVDTIKTILFLGHTTVEFTPVQRAKIAEYFKQRNLDGWEHARWLAPGGTLTPDEDFWLTGPHVLRVKWEDVDAIKVSASGKTASGVVTGSYGGWDAKRQVWASRQRYRSEAPIEAPNIDPEKVLYVQGNEWTAQNEVHRTHGDLVPKDYFIIALPENRLAKFKRDFPKAITVRQFKEDATKRALAAIPAADKKALRFQHAEGYQVNILAFMKSRKDEYLDPDLREAIDLATREIPAALKDLTQRISREQLWHTLPKYDSPLEKYPLLSRGEGNTTREHNVLYANAVYAARKESA